MSKKFVDINNLNKFLSNAKKYVDDNTILTPSNSSFKDYSGDEDFASGAYVYAISNNDVLNLGKRRHLRFAFSGDSGDLSIDDINFQFTCGYIPTTIDTSYYKKSDGLYPIMWKNNTRPYFQPWTKYSISVKQGFAEIDGSENLLNKYFTLKAVENCQFKFIKNNNNGQYIGNLYYSLDGGKTWTTGYPSNVSVAAGEEMILKGNLKVDSYNPASGIGYISSTGKYEVEGNIMSLIYLDSFSDKINLLQEYQFAKLFYSSTTLINAGNLVLPTKTLINHCYYGMFQGCSSLHTAPDLPATTLAQYCYAYMFKGCSSLHTSPDLPATTLAQYCYAYMFQNCSSLENIKVYATDISASNCLNNWLSGVDTSGQFLKSKLMDSFPTGVSGIPNGWVVNEIDRLYSGAGAVKDLYIKRYLTFTALESGTFSFYRRGGTGNIQYSLNNGVDWDILEDFQNIFLQEGQSVIWKGDLRPVDIPVNQNKWPEYVDAINNIYDGAPQVGIGRFISTGKFNVCGNIMSLLYGDDFIGKYEFPVDTPFIFGSLFGHVSEESVIGSNPNYHHSKVVECSGLILPARTATKACYYCLFAGAEYMETGPELLFEKTSYYCCYCMFQNCSSLNVAPRLQAKKLTDSCYIGMFQNCSSLTQIELFAEEMSDNYCTYDWMKGVPSHGFFDKKSLLTIETGDNGIPTGWSVDEVNLVNEIKKVDFLI